MAKEMIYIDFTKGHKQFDTSKMSEWTREEWKEWTAESDDNLGIHKVLFDDAGFYFKMTSLYYDEATNDMYVTFDAQNKTNRLLKTDEFLLYAKKESDSKANSNSFFMCIFVFFYHWTERIKLDSILPF